MAHSRRADQVSAGKPYDLRVHDRGPGEDACRDSRHRHSHRAERVQPGEPHGRCIHNGGAGVQAVTRSRASSIPQCWRSYNPGTPSGFTIHLLGVGQREPERVVHRRGRAQSRLARTRAMRRIGPTMPRRSAATGGGPEVFTFSEGRAPFASLPDAWQARRAGPPPRRGRRSTRTRANGRPFRCGTARAITPANATTIVVADTAPDPTKPPG